MIQDDYRAAIDLGTTKVCTILGKRRSDGSIEVAGVGVAPCAGLRRGLVVDPAATAAAVRASVQAASANAGLTIRRAYLGLTGSHVQSRNQWSRVDGHGNVSVVTQADIRRALSVAGSDAAEDGRKLLHVVPRSYALDGIYGVRNPIGMHASELYVQTHVILGDDHPIRSLVAAATAAGVSVAGLVVQPLGAADAVLTESEREEGAVLVDIGGGTSDIAVFYEGSIIHTAVLPLGGYQFTNDLAVAFECSFEEAERIKLQHGTVTPELAAANEEFEIASEALDEPLMMTKRELGHLLKDRAVELFKLIRMKLDVPYLGDVPLTRMVLTGGGAKLPGLHALARYTMQGQVRIAAPRGAQGLPEERRNPAYSASVGILLWGMRNLPRENHLSAPRAEAAARGGRRPRLFDAMRGLFPGGRSRIDARAPDRTPAGT